MTKKRVVPHACDTTLAQRLIYETLGLAGATSSRPENSRYPAWVCFDCATKAGGKLRDPESATYHTGDCEVCGITQWVTQPRDYGYPRFE
jgi:hypothetical protein